MTTPPAKLGLLTISKDKNSLNCAELAALKDSAVANASWSCVSVQASVGPALSANPSMPAVCAAVKSLVHWSAD